MTLGIIIFSIIGTFGVFSILQQQKRKKVIDQIIADYIQENNYQLINVQKSIDSGPFNDEWYDKKFKNIYANIGYSKWTTLYKIVQVEKEEKKSNLYLQIRFKGTRSIDKNWMD